MKLAGIVLIVLGVLALAYHGIRYIDRDKLIDIGPVKVTTSVKKTIPVPPAVAALAVIVGIGLVFADRKKT